MKQLSYCTIALLFLAACSVKPKKLIVLTQGTANINTDKRTITASGNGHEEKTVLFHSESDVTLQLSSQLGEASVTLQDGGVFILNMKNDTIVGSFVNYTAPKTEVNRISEEQMRRNIDSLEQIIAGNVSAEKRTFFILPNQAVKISDNPDAHIVTPYHQMTSIAVKKDEVPEVYRFYPIAEARATLQKLRKMMGEEGPVNDAR